MGSIVERRDPDTDQDWTAGARAKGGFRCRDCGYGVTVYRSLPTCPMCGGIVERIGILWGTVGMSRYFTEILFDERGDREGFPPEVMAEIFALPTTTKQRSPRAARSSPPGMTAQTSIGSSGSRSRSRKSGTDHVFRVGSQSSP